MANPLAIVLDGAAARGNVRVALLVDIPAGNNAAGVSYATAAMLRGGEAYTPAPAAPPGDGTNGTISAAERVNLLLATRVQFQLSLSLPSDWSTQTAPQKAAFFDSWALDRQTELQSRLVQMLDDVGRVRQVP